MFSYLAYGLGVHSALPLPEFVCAEAGCDVTIQLDTQAPFFPSPLPPERYLTVTQEEAILSLAQVGTFRVCHGKEIWVTPAAEADEALLRLYITGTLMALLLYQRGLLPLHASAVEIQGEAVAFLGESGWGKSSLAAALHQRGHRILTDDVTAVDIKTIPPQVYPAFPQLKLHPKTAASLGYDREPLLMLHPLEEKRGFRFAHHFSATLSPLQAIYLLDEGPRQHIDPVDKQMAIVELIRHSYPTRLLQQGSSAHFLHSVALVQQVPIYRLVRQQTLAALPALAQMIETHTLEQRHLCRKMAAGSR